MGLPTEVSALRDRNDWPVARFESLLCKVIDLEWIAPCAAKKGADKEEAGSRTELVTLLDVDDMLDRVPVEPVDRLTEDTGSNLSIDGFNGQSKASTILSNPFHSQLPEEFFSPIDDVPAFGFRINISEGLSNVSGA